MRAKRVLAITAVVVVVIGVGSWFAIDFLLNRDPFTPLYVDNCAVCHGESMQGAAQGPALIGAPLKHGESVAELAQSIGNGFAATGMPPWSANLSQTEITSLALLIAERRMDMTFTDFRMAKPLEISADPIVTEQATFRLETVASGIDPYPFSIAPLPDGRILVTEKKQGLSIVETDGTQSAPITGTPATSDSGAVVLGLNYGLGWLLDVAIHPDYAINGWVYLHHTHLCADCSGQQTMNRVIRGHIKDGAWTDEEVIWQVPESFYSSLPDIGAGGRLAFDRAGHVFLSVGIKGGYFEGIQDLSTPYGKIHRVNDDGSIPPHNPFVETAGAMPSVFTYGHRSPQGLEFDPATNLLWGSEMGPRGGDEINVLRPGRNYGWPLHSKGLDYDGTPVEYGNELGIEFDLADIEQPIVDFTPSPAVSSFVIYEGDAFPGWRGQFLVGTLKATALYRVEIRGERHVRTEVLLNDLARVRDIEVGGEGVVYLLLEHEAGSQIVRMVPAT